MSNIELTSQSNRIDIHGSRQRYDFCASSVKYEQLLPLLIVESELGGSTDHYWSTCPYWCQLCFTIRHVEGVCHYIPVGEDLKRCSGSHTERLKSGRQQDAYKKGKSDCELAIKNGYFEVVGKSVKKREQGRQDVSQSRNQVESN